MPVIDEHGVRHRVRYDPHWTTLGGGNYGHTFCETMFVYYEDRPAGVEKMKRAKGSITCLACAGKDIPFLPYE